MKNQRTQRRLNACKFAGCIIPPANPSIKEKGARSIFPQWILMTCPVKHIRSRFITENCNSILNITPEFFKTALVSEFLFVQIHDDDQPDVHRCFLFVDNYIKNLPPEEYLKLRIAMQFRYRQQDGRYITLHDEKDGIILPDDTVLYYAIIKDITEK